MADKGITTSIVALIAGLGACAVTLFVAEGLSLWLASPPDNLDISDRAALADYVDGVGLGPQLLLVLGWGLGSLFGAKIAFRISHGLDWTSWVVALGMIGMIMPALLAYEHPDWMFAAATLLPLAGAFIVTRYWRKRIDIRGDGASEAAAREESASAG